MTEAQRKAGGTARLLHPRRLKAEFDDLQGHRVSGFFSEAKKAIASYRNSIGQPAGLAELMVFYCERASGFSAEVGLQDEAYFGALVKMFERALQMLSGLDEAQRLPLLKRLHAVHQVSQRIGYGVDDAMSDLLVEYGFGVDRP